MEKACPCITDIQDTAVVGRKKKKATFRWFSLLQLETPSSSVFAPRKEEMTDSSHMLLLEWVSIFQSFTFCHIYLCVAKSTPSEVTRRGQGNGQGDYPKN